MNITKSAVPTLIAMVCFSCGAVSDGIKLQSAEISGDGNVFVHVILDSYLVSRLAEDAPMKNTAVYIYDCSHAEGEQKAFATYSRWTMQNEASINGGRTIPETQVNAKFQCEQKYYTLSDHKSVPVGAVNWKSACLVTKVSSLIGDRFKASTQPGDLGQVGKICQQQPAR
jgi:hypothetical protein